MLIRTLSIIFFCLSSALAWAADPASPAAESKLPPAGNKAAEFARINKEYNDLIASLGALKIEYNTATDTAKKSEIYKQLKEGFVKATAMEKQVVAAAEAAYKEAPNSDANIAELLTAILGDDVKTEDYEAAFALGKTLMDNKCANKYVPALAGVAAYCVNEYDLAGAWLNAARATGTLSKLSEEMHREDYANYPDMIEMVKAGWAKEKQIREAEAKAGDLPRVVMKTSAGEMEIELFENEAPNTVLNFITLVEKGFYNGLKFHRVLPCFMAQGGDPKGDGTGGPGYTIPCECGRPDHRLHFRGSLSMAHAGPDTGGSQFFLTFVPTKHLDGKHTVFGRVVSGFDVLAKLKRRNPQDATVGAADTIIEAKVKSKRPHSYDAKDLKKSNPGG